MSAAPATATASTASAILSIETQFASLELCQHLALLDVPQTTQFIWIASPTGHPLIAVNYGSVAPRGFLAPAWSVSELREILKGQHYLVAGDDDRTDHDAGEAHCVAEERVDGSWQWAAYVEGPFRKIHHLQIADTDANAHAKLLIHLKENALFREAQP